MTVFKNYCYHYRPQRSWGKVIFSQASVILFTGGGLPQCMLGYHTPWQEDPPGKADPPGMETPTGKADAPWQGRPPGKETPCAVHAGRYGQQAEGIHPTGMQFLIRMYIERHCSQRLTFGIIYSLHGNDSTEGYRWRHYKTH